MAIWTRILNWLKRTAPSGAERRRSTRYALPRDAAKVIAFVEGSSGLVQIRNISAGGIGLLLDRGFDPDTVLSVQLLRRPEMQMTRVRVRVTYALEHPNGEWVIGGAFEQKLTDQQLQSLLS